MSGGVDSSVAAALMKKRGWDVIGVTLQIWQESQTDPRHAGCCSLGAVEDARRTAAILDIPHYVLNFREEFRESVIQNFVDEYAAGRTPNPCVMCNRTVKFEMLKGMLKDFDCDVLVTGHYARIRRVGGTSRLLAARSWEKDQSYVLFGLNQAQIEGLHFPIGELPDKSVTRQMAREMGLFVAEKPDSQEICFISEAGGHREFLKKARPELARKGAIVDTSGNVLGEHFGAAGFTIGQRRGLGVASGRPLYVLRVDPMKNEVVVGDETELLQQRVYVDRWIWTGDTLWQTPIKVEAKIRYNMQPRPAKLHLDPEPYLEFDEPVRAVAPGQFAVAYRGKTVLGGGTISG